MSDVSSCFSGESVVIDVDLGLQLLVFLLGPAAHEPVLHLLQDPCGPQRISCHTAVQNAGAGRCLSLEQQLKPAQRASYGGLAGYLQWCFHRTQLTEATAECSAVLLSLIYGV